MKKEQRSVPSGRPTTGGFPLRSRRLMLVSVLCLFGAALLAAPALARIVYAVAYTSNRSSTNQIYLFDNTASPYYIALTSATAPSSAPTLFPEFHDLYGCKVAFQRYQSGNNDIYVKDILFSGVTHQWYATNETVLVSGSTDDTQPAWSPLEDTLLNQYTNKNKIAFTRVVSGYKRLFWVGAPLGPTTSGPAPGTSGSPSTPAQLTATGSYDDFSAAWSPTGDKIVFVSNRDGHNQLYLLDVSSGSAGSVTRLTNTTSTNDRAPTWMGGSGVTGQPNAQIVFERDGVLYSIDMSTGTPGTPTYVLRAGDSAISGLEPALGPLSQEVFYQNSGNNLIYHDLLSTGSDISLTTDGGSSVVNTEPTVAAGWADMGGIE